MTESEYITNPRFVRWFGPEVTRARAVICGVGALLNSYLLLTGSTSASHSKSMWDFVMEVVDFFLMIGFIGPASVFFSLCIRSPRVNCLQVQRSLE